jgi:hypothetical protein
MLYAAPGLAGNKALRAEIGFYTLGDRRDPAQ